MKRVVLRTSLALAAAALVAAAVPATSATPVAAPSASPAAALAGPDISLTNTQAHLDQLQAIATANGGNRATGRPGYLASLTWVRSKLDAAGYTTTVQQFATSSGTSYNLVAEWPAGDANHVVMTGGHLDSVAAGPGINDNGTGSAGILETALTWAASGQVPRNRIKFAFWGAEEQGLLGSKRYMSTLPTAEKDRIELYLNFDMIGSPNPGYFVYDDNAAGDGARDDLTSYFDSVGVPWEYVDVQGRSDHAAFRSYGIPTAGTYTGAEELKTAAQAQKWGGTANRAFDPCYHAACDIRANVNTTALDRNIDAIGHLVWSYAQREYGATLPPAGADPVKNPGFEQGATSWTGTAGAITSSTGRPSHSGTWKAWLGGNGRTTTENLTQSVAVPTTGTRATLTFWVRIDTAETGSTRYDTTRVQVVNGSTTSTLATYSNLDASSGYVQRTLDLTSYRGRTVSLRFLTTEDASLQPASWSTTSRSRPAQRCLPRDLRRRAAPLTTAAGNVCTAAVVGPCMTVPTIELTNGTSIPQLGFGVYQVPPEETADTVRKAFEVGYRHIDTAQMYQNEAGVGEAIRDAGIPRDELYVTSKLNNGFHRPDDARRAFGETLERLGLDRIDLFLIHWPLPTRYDGDFVSTWKTLGEFVEDGRAASIGVSNFQPAHLDRIVAETGVVPVVNQVEVHPFFTNEQVRAANARHGVLTEAWSPIAQGAVNDDATIGQIAERVGRSAAQVTLRWHLQRGDIIFPKSVNVDRMRQNFEIFDFELSADDLAALDGLDRGEQGRTGPNPDTFDYIPD